MGEACEDRSSKFDVPFERQLECTEISHLSTRLYWLSGYSTPTVVEPTYKKTQSVSSDQNIAVEHQGFEMG